MSGIDRLNTGNGGTKGSAYAMSNLKYLPDLAADLGD